MTPSSEEALFASERQHSTFLIDGPRRTTDKPRVRIPIRSDNSARDVAKCPFFGTSGLPGDFNRDGAVDASDYVVWRNGKGIIYTQNDYEVWRCGATVRRAAVGGRARASRRSAGDPKCFARTINSSTREMHQELTVVTPAASLKNSHL